MMQIPRIFKTRAFFFSVVLHLAIIAFLVIGIEPSVKLAPAPTTKPLMEAKAVNLAAIEAEKKRKADLLVAQKQAELEKKQAAEKKRQEAEEQKKQQQLAREKAQKKEQEKKALEEALAKREAQKKKDQALKEKQAAEAKAAKKKAAEEKAKKEALEKEKREKAKKEKEKKEREQKEREKAKKEAEEQARQQALKDALEAEEREMAEALQRAAEESEIAKYTLRITASVSRAFSYPPGLEDGLNCTLYVRMIPGGEVIEAKVIKSSGSPTFDRQAENAVRKASPLPVPSEPKLFDRMREIQFTFDPDN